MTKKIIFLETTIQADKIFAERTYRDKIRQNLKGKRVCTSTFVLNQFKKTFLDSMICLYNLLIDSETIEDTLRRSTKYFDRKNKRIIQVFAKLCEEVSYDKKAILERLETYIEDALIMEFELYINEPFLDETSCKWASGEPIKKDSRYAIAISCRKNTPHDCNIENFWKDHKDELRNLASSTLLSGSKDEDLNKICDTAKSIKDKSGSPYGQNCTIHLSDALIAIESPKGGQIYSTNKKHFEPICKVIKDRTVYKEV